MSPAFDSALLTGWVRAATQALERHRAEIDRINVFPVADRDTGTNLLLTMRSAAEAARPEGSPVLVARALARGALTGARGNSGVILSQVLRGVADAVAARVGPSAGGAVLTDALRRADRLATAAVSRPRHGTVLTVLAAASRAAAAVPGDRLDEVAVAAADAARAALAATPRQLQELRAAGVVDAGGMGLVVVLDALAALATGRGVGAAAPAGPVAAGRSRRSAVTPPLALPATAPSAPAPSAPAPSSPLPDTALPDTAFSDTAPSVAALPDTAFSDAAPPGTAPAATDPPGTDPASTDPPGTDPPGAEPAAGTAALRTVPPPTAVAAGPAGCPPGATDPAHPPAYEVAYLLDGTDAHRVDALRAALDGLGDSVAVVGDGDLWTVHVHTADIGAAVEAGTAAGRPHAVRVEPLPAVPVPPGRTRARAVLMVVGGPGAAGLARAAGATVVGRGTTEDGLVAALRGTGARHVVLLPDDPDLTPVAERAASAARRTGQDVVVVPTSSVLQGLAALAVHDPDRRTGDDVVAMVEAAAGTRTAALAVAESEALTWVGRCEPGDVLGIADGEVVVIAPDLAVGGLWLAHRMLLAGGEMVTVLLGAGVDDELGAGLAADLRRTHPGIDVVVHRGDQTDHPLLLGVE